MMNVQKIIYLVKNVVDLILRLIGPLFVVAAASLILLVIYIFLYAVIPYHYPDGLLNYWTGYIHVIVSAYLSFNIGWNYILCIFTNPGYTDNVVTISSDGEDVIDSAPKKGEGFSRYCKACKRAKPLRTHHCHICKKCVLRMDHHCPWVCNCVGFYNHKYFVLFMLYLWLGCAYVALMSFLPFGTSSNFRVPWKGISSRGTIIFTFVITVSVFMALGFMLAWHMYLVVSGQTTIEFYYNKYRQKLAASRGEIWHNEFDLGAKRNFQLFFGAGKYWFSWLLPSLSSPAGDGITYITRTQLFKEMGHVV